MYKTNLSFKIIAFLVVVTQLFSFFPAVAGSTLVLDQARLGNQQPGSQSAALTTPLSISRVQSSYTEGTTTITFEVTNNLPPTRLPEVPPGATITDTINVLAGFEVTDDANTLRNLSIVDTLAAGVTLLGVSRDPDQNGSTLTWELPDLAPQTSAIITLTFQTPAASSNFIDLDSGAEVSAEQWGNAISSSARPAVIIPAGIDSVLTEATSDADIFDAEMLWKAAEFAQDPLAMFEYVRSFDFDPYQGSLRGTRGTLWGEAGNSLDQSSLLIAMLRAAGVPARYRHGTLSTTNAQTLIESMFTAPQGLAGYLPEDVETADPLNDAELIALVQDHWWVEAYLPGSGWSDLDPTFPDAQLGDIFATPGGSDRIAEVPDNLRHKVSVKLEIERYSQFPISGSNLVRSTPLEVNFTTAELAARRFIFASMVDTQEEGGFTFQTTTHTYTPYIAIDAPDRLIYGQPFQDMVTNFPLGTVFTTGAWLTFEIQDAIGQTETFTRPVKDLLGPDVRLNGGVPNLAITPDDPPLLSISDLYTTWILPNAAPAQQQTRMLGLIYASMVTVAQKSQELNALTELADQRELTPVEIAASQDAIFETQLALSTSLSYMGLNYAVEADQNLESIERGTRVKYVHDRPRVVTVASIFEPVSGALAWNVDLRTTYANAIVAPGQATAAQFSANWFKGVSESYLEGQTIEEITELPAVTTARLFDEMALQGISPIYLTPADAAILSPYTLPDDAKALITTALYEGKHVLVPSEPVMVDGDPLTGWWQIDPLTGETIGVMENGLHNAFLEDLKFTVKLTKNTFKQYSKIAEGLGKLFDKIIERIQQATGNGAQQALFSAADEWRFLPAYLCPVDNCGIEQFFLQGFNSSPIPLPEMLFGYQDDSYASEFAIAALDIIGSGGGSPAFTLAANPTSSTIAPHQTASFIAGISSNFDDDFTVAAYVPQGWQVTLDSGGNVAAEPAEGTLPGDYTLQITAQSTQYPNLVENIAYVVTVTPGNDLDLTVSPENQITIPMGTAQVEGASNQTNDGEAEFGSTAYLIEFANPTGSLATFTITTSGLPANWTVLNGQRQTSASVTLPIGGRAQIGLYVSPPSGTIPAVGTSHTINVNITGGSLADAASTAWTMPSQAFNYLTIQPDKLYLSSDSSIDFSIQMMGVGNSNGSFPLTPILPPISATISGLGLPVSLAVGETHVQTATIETSGLPLGAHFPLVLGSTAPGSYTQYALGEVQVISEDSEVVFRAADNAAEFCTLGEPGFSDALESLAYAMVHLEASCQSGVCNPSLRDQTVSATDGVALYAEAVSTELVSLDALMAAADALSGHDQVIDITADISALSAAVNSLDDEVCAWSQHKPQLRWTPYYSAALQNESTTYTLELTNLGSLATTYALTVTLPGAIVSEQVSINPGETQLFDYPLTIANVGLYDLNAHVEVLDQETIADETAARLNVVDRFVQLTAVQPDPDFVETGSSFTTIWIDVANIANVAQEATARTTINSPDGSLTHSGDTPLTILVGAPRSYELETINTSSWAEGVYTVTVALLDGSETLIPDGSGYGYLGVGQLLGASHALTPQVVPPGTVTVTTQITTELLVPGIVPATISHTAQPVTISSDTEVTEISGSAIIFAPQAVNSTVAITRTQDISSSIVYSGSWSVVNNIFASHTSDGSYTASNTPGDTATFTFSGSWVHIGFLKARNGGLAEIFIDGLSQGTVDLYHPVQQCFTAVCTVSAAYDGLSASSHILEIVVSGTAHPNANGLEVKLDYIDTWDGTTYPDGTYEQDNARVWNRTGVWNTINEPAASGGSFMQAADTQSVWFPFTGDSATFVALARYDSHRVRVSVDGIWQGDVLIYSSEPISKTYSFAGFGDGPHVMQVSGLRRDTNIDAFITPAIGPDYDPPIYAGLVRYEEDDPALRYNGYDFTHRPNSWSSGNAGQASEYSYSQSSTISDTVSLTFEGNWINIGLRTRNRGGLADVNIDGISYGTINAYAPSENVVSYQFPVITGTHTLTITVLGQSDPVNAYNQVYLDYIEIWDSSPVSDEFQNARKGEESGRVHVSSSASDGSHENALQGDFVNSGLPNSIANVWYGFVGDSFTFYGLTESNGGSAEVYVDGQLIDTVSFEYPFSVQPFAFNYTGFDDGPHSVRVHNVWEMRVDGFAANQPDLPYQPIAEWWDDTPGGGTGAFGTPAGMLMGIAAGDLDGDGLIELVAPSDTYTNGGFINSIFIYRGDGQDAGDGTPLINRIDFPANGFGVGREVIGSVVLADLDGQPGAEIIVGSERGMYAFHHTGVTYWFTDTFQGGSNGTTITPAVGNLDLDSAPEIVVNLGNVLAVYTADGDIAWFETYTSEAGMPVLADLTGDGLLDIVAYDFNGNVRLYDYNFGTPQLLWSTPLSTTIGSIRGGPAIADVDGDGTPEIAISHSGYLSVLDGDGNLVWSAELDPGAPGGVSVADIDGDGEIEIVTGMMFNDGIGMGRLYALNADGSILWDRPAYDDTSANSQSVLDLDGDGIYEIAWNGAQYGFTIFNGADGEIIFNEPLAESLTSTDYPIFADVDGDDYAEVVAPTNGGIVVFGLDGVWGNARPLWNQHSYHITNINDDLSIPFSEPNSWEAHNTYRTQTPQRYPMPVYSVALTHTVGIDSLSVLTDTFNVTPDVSVDPLYGWDYDQTWETPVVTRTFSSQLTNLQPGESRLVAEGTRVEYTLSSGSNQVELPPLYVSVAHIADLQPAALSLGNGAIGSFNLILSNPGPVALVYTPTLTALSGIEWGMLDPVVVPALSEVSLPLTARVALDALVETLNFSVNVETEMGGNAQVGGEIDVLGPLVIVELSSDDPAVPTGSTAVFTLTVSNLENTQNTYNLSAEGIAQVILPAQITVAGNSVETILIGVQPVGEGSNPFSVIATEESNTASAADTAAVIGEGFSQVVVSLEPAGTLSGPGVATPLRVLVTNLGNFPQTFTLNTNLPINWNAALTLLGSPVTEILVASGAGNIVELQLLVTPAHNVTPGDYEIAVNAQSVANAVVNATGAAEVQVGELGVNVMITSGPSSIPPTGSATWNVQITNLGQSADSYDLEIFGPLGLFAELSQASVNLAAGGSQTVQVIMDNYDLALTGEIILGLHAQSQSQRLIQAEDGQTVTINGEESVQVAWQPDAITLDGITSTTFTLVITNTGNTLTTFGLLANGNPSLDVHLSTGSIILPPNSTATLPVPVTAPGGGIYAITATVESDNVQGIASAILTVEGVEPPQEGLILYLPLVLR